MLRSTPTTVGASSRITIPFVHMFFTPTALFAFAHTSGHVMAKAEPGNRPAYPPLGENPASASRPERPSTPHHGRSRSRTAPTPAVPQAFRR